MKGSDHPVISGKLQKYKAGFSATNTRLLRCNKNIAECSK